MERKIEDNRFTLDSAKKRYINIYEQLQNNPKNFDQTPLWYEIYNRHRDNTIVFGSNRDYLLLRDMHAQTILLMIVYTFFCRMYPSMAFSWKYILYLFLMTIVLNISAKVQGKRLVYNVLSVDLNFTNHSDITDIK